MAQDLAASLKSDIPAMINAILNMGLMVSVNMEDLASRYAILSWSKWRLLYESEALHFSYILLGENLMFQQQLGRENQLFISFQRDI